MSSTNKVLAAVIMHQLQNEDEGEIEIPSFVKTEEHFFSWIKEDNDSLANKKPPAPKSNN